MCSPVRAEEGITGFLCAPGSSIPFRDLPTSQQIGGYPTTEQLAASEVDGATLDSEGRCIILEFPAFVLLGVYCPANRDETRDDFRHGFLEVLDHRVRNLVAMGKRVVLAGDINVARNASDSARAKDLIRKGKLTPDEFCSAPARRLFNQLVRDVDVIGDRDPRKEMPVLWDSCREFHPGRSGMYTCWEQRINARPGNFGARIDYILCSLDMSDWILSANIQEELMVRVSVHLSRFWWLTRAGLRSLSRVRCFQKQSYCRRQGVEFARYYESTRLFRRRKKNS